MKKPHSTNRINSYFDDLSTRKKLPSFIWIQKVLLCKYILFLSQPRPLLSAKKKWSAKNWENFSLWKPKPQPVGQKHRKCLDKLQALLRLCLVYLPQFYMHLRPEAGDWNSPMIGSPSDGFGDGFFWGLGIPHDLFARPWIRRFFWDTIRYVFVE